MAQRKMKYTPEQEALFPKPQPTQEYCDVCGAQAMFFFNDRDNSRRENFCTLHVPEDFNIPKSTVREFEELFLALENETTGSASNAPAVNSSASKAAATAK